MSATPRTRVGPIRLLSRVLLVVAVAAAGGWWAPGPAMAAVLQRTAETQLTLPSNVTINPGQEVPLLTVDFDMPVPRQRRLTASLATTISSSEGAEIDLHIVCVDRPSGADAGYDYHTGRNHRGSDHGEMRIKGTSV